MKVKRKPSDGRIMVSKNFHLAQFVQGGRPAPHPFQVQSIFKLAEQLEAHAKARGAVPHILEVDATYETATFYFDVPGVDERHTVGRIEL